MSPTPLVTGASSLHLVLLKHHALDRLHLILASSELSLCRISFEGWVLQGTTSVWVCGHFWVRPSFSPTNSPHEPSCFPQPSCCLPSYEPFLLLGSFLCFTHSQFLINWRPFTSELLQLRSFCVLVVFYWMRMPTGRLLTISSIYQSWYILSCCFALPLRLTSCLTTRVLLHVLDVRVQTRNFPLVNSSSHPRAECTGYVHCGEWSRRGMGKLGCPWGKPCQSRFSPLCSPSQGDWNTVLTVEGLTHWVTGTSGSLESQVTIFTIKNNLCCHCLFCGNFSFWNWYD